MRQIDIITRNHAHGEYTLYLTRRLSHESPCHLNDWDVYLSRVLVLTLIPQVLFRPTSLFLKSTSYIPHPYIHLDMQHLWYNAFEAGYDQYPRAQTVADFYICSWCTTKGKSWVYQIIVVDNV